jgi:hypothetical protein
MPDKRVEALNSINKNDYSSKYITLSDNTKIGVNLIQDLKKYFQLEFKNKYRYNYRKWTMIEDILPEEIYTDAAASAPAAPAPADDSVHVDAAPDKANNIIYKVINEEGDDGIAIRNLIKYIQDIYKKSPDDSTDIEIPEKIFNSDIALRKNYRDKSINYGYIPIIKIEKDGGKHVHYKPFLEYNYTNYDFQEKSQIYDDLNKLNSIFKKNNYKDLDDLVILDFYKDFTKKVEKLKDDIISRDDDIKYDLIDNIYEKLAIIYEIKLGRNKKINKKPIKEIVKAENKTPKDICDISIKNKTNLFYEILCDINKRAEIFNNLTKLKSGGKHKASGGAATDAAASGAASAAAGTAAAGAGTAAADEILNDTITKILSSATDDEKQRYKTYLEIDKNILEKFIDDEKFKQHISTLSSSNIVKKVVEAFKKKPKKINGNIEKSTVTFQNFNNFIEKIKDRAIEDSNRYLAIIKSLNIIMKNALIESQPLTTTPQTEEETEEEATVSKKASVVGGVGYQKEMPSNIRNQGNQKQAVDDKMSVNPGKEYLKNLTDIYINLAKEYGKFINDENEVKELIKSVIKSPTDNEKKPDAAAPAAPAPVPAPAAPAATPAAPPAPAAPATPAATPAAPPAPAAPATPAATEKDKKGEDNEKKELEDLENQNKDNEKKSKNLEERKKQLTASLKIIKEELKKLYKVCTDINLPYATEYNDFVKNIIKVGQLKYIIDDNPQINNNNEIIEAYNKELATIDKDLGDIKIDIESNKKIIKDKKDVIVSQGRRRGGQDGGASSDEEKENNRLKMLLDGNLYKLINKKDNYNLYNFIEELKTVFGDDNEDGLNNASVKKYNENETLYEQIWNDYNEGVKSYYNNAKDKSALTYINEGEKLKNKVILYDLDPEIVLKITFQDKVVFLALMFAIRTFIMVLFEFLIDYNVVKSLRYAILIYAVIYLLILLLFTAFVNLDSYKLRIVFNYLNMHINTPGIILHVMLFIIFSLLVIIIIQTDNFINNLGDILDYTYIYNYIYTFNFDNILSGEFENNLTKDEKIKLQYRLDIISMLIFIFSGTLILLM